MSLYIAFPTNRSQISAEDLISNSPVGVRNQWVSKVSDDTLSGAHRTETGDVTALFSGTLTNVPASFPSGAGALAARSLAAIYLKEGISALGCLDGSFCFAIVDHRNNKVFVGRDKLGIARAYLARREGRLAFSDSLTSLLENDGDRFEVDIDSIYAFLTIGWIPTPHSMFREIEKVPAGVFLESSGGGLSRTIYYDVPHEPKCLVRRERQELTSLVQEHLDRSVLRGVQLGGRWGSFLSGGVDSSSVVMSLSKMVPPSFPTYFGGFAPQLNRYLPNPEEPAMSELVATKSLSHHHMLWLQADAVQSVPEIVAALEEPVCDGGCIIVSQILKVAKAEADGLMTGVGGDFLFTGERRHMVLSLLRRMRHLPSPLWQSLRWLSGKSPFSRSTRISQAHFDLTRLLDIRSLHPSAMYAGFYRQAELDELDQLLLPSTRTTISRDPTAEIAQLFDRAKNADALTQFLYLDLKTQATEHCVRETEALGRYFQINTYNPFLDAEFVDFAMSIPADQKISGLELKVPLKSAMRGIVPDAILDRKKGGLGSPIRWWVTQKQGLVADTLSRQSIQSRGLFSADAVEQFRRATLSGTRDFTKLLWSLFTLELWFRKFVDH